MFQLIIVYKLTAKKNAVYLNKHLSFIDATKDMIDKVLDIEHAHIISCHITPICVG